MSKQGDKQVVKVGSFNPADYWVDISKKKDRSQLYLEVRFLKTWFSEVYPDGVIRYTGEVIGERHVVHAHIFSSGHTLPDNANFLGQGSATVNPFAYKTQDKSIEKAQTTAKGRALRDCAFCAHLALIDDEFGQDVTNGDFPTDSIQDLHGITVEQIAKLVKTLKWTNDFHIRNLIAGGVLNTDNWNNAAEIRAKEYKNLCEMGHSPQEAMDYILKASS